MKNKGRVENLIPFSELSEEKQREIRSKGGKASVKKRNEARTWKEFYTRMITEKYISKPRDGERIETTFDDLSKEAIYKIVKKADASTVALWKEMKGTIEGEDVNINANVNVVDITAGMTNEEKIKLAKLWAEKHLLKE